MKSSWLGTLEYNGFVYRIFEDINDIAVQQVIGDVDCASILCGGGTARSVRYIIEEGKLYAAEINLLIRDRDRNELLLRSAQKPVCTKRQGYVSENERLVPQELCELTYEGLHEFVDYSGSLLTRQVYVDEREARYGGATHPEESVFVFASGRLTDASRVHGDPEPLIAKYTWNDTLERAAASGALAEEGRTSRALYFVDPTGSVAQNNGLISICVNYCATNRCEASWIEEIVSYREPVLRVEYKGETEPGSGRFSDGSCDLVTAVIERQDVGLLRRIYDHIQFAKYPDYPERMLAALFRRAEDADTAGEEEVLDACIAILRVFSERGLRCSGALQYRSKMEQAALKDARLDEKQRRIVTLLRSIADNRTPC